MTEQTMSGVEPFPFYRGPDALTVRHVPARGDDRMNPGPPIRKSTIRGSPMRLLLQEKFLASLFRTDPRSHDDLARNDTTCRQYAAESTHFTSNS